MILYDKKSTFLGMGQSELSMLGYEDMEEFKSYFSDFADLFVDHPGYISKFKNFSWIDYALHSGAPNKNVLLKHKNGTDIETGLQISEIFLAQPINGETTVYCIELGINTSSPNTPIKQNIKLPDKNTHVQETPKEEHIKQENKNRYNFDENLVDDYMDDETNKEDNLTDIEIKQEKIVDDKKDVEISLKSHNNEDNKSITEDTPYINEQIYSNKEESQEEHPNKLKIVFDVEDDIELETKIETIPQEEDIVKEDINSETTTIPLEDRDSIKIQNQYETEDIDLTQIAEDTGMDLGDIAEFIEDFIKEAENYLEKLNNYDNLSNIDFIKNETIKLKGVASNLKITTITNTLNNILQNTDKNRLEDLLKLLKKQVKNLEEQLF